MNKKEEFVEIFKDVASEGISFQSSSFEALDTKAEIVVAYSSLLATIAGYIIQEDNIIGCFQSVLIVSMAVTFILTIVFSVATIMPRKFHYGLDVTKVRTLAKIKPEPLYIKGQVSAGKEKAFKKNLGSVWWKHMFFRVAFFSSILAIIQFISYIILYG